jgi:signal transduction histidine kinase
MRFRYRSIRARTFFLVLTPLVSLVGLYIFATTVAASDAIALGRSTAVRDSIADPVGLFAAQVQQERLAAGVFLARPSQQAAAALSAQEPKTNAALSTLQTAVAPVAGEGDPGVRSAISALLQQVAGLPTLRARVASKSVSKTAAEQAYTAVIVAGYRAIGASFLQMPNVHLVSQSSAVLRVAEAEDALLQAQALLAADAAAGSFPAADRAQFAMLTGDYQGLLGEALPDLDPAYRAPFARVAGSPQAATLNALDAQVINAPPGRTGVSAADYGRVAQTVALGLALTGFSAGQQLAGALHASAGPINVRLAVTGGVGLAAIIASIALSVWIGRGIVRELAALRGDALELARQRLPQVMARLSSGHDVDVEAEAPLLPAGADEIGQVRQAFNTVQRAAIEAAAGQARLRDGVATVFRNLAMRSQSLLHQQLFLLDTLEQRAGGPEELERLFQIDHLATRMRRNAEGLLVLAGDQPGRTWTEPVPMVDVLRGSVAEVVDYARIRVACSSRAALQGHAVADVIHLIAELAENATAYSPPESPVRVSGTEVVRGFAVEVEDRGLGIPAYMIARLNAALSDPPPFNPAESAHLGLYIAARLAQRHGIGITLRDSPYGGTTAIVFIPHGLIVSDGQHYHGQAPGTDPHAFAASGQAGREPGLPGVALSGRHASRDTPRGAGIPSGGAAPAPAVAAPPRAHAPGSVSSPPSPAGSPASHAAHAGTLAGAEFQLPRRIRQANLPPHLLKSATARHTADPKPADGLSPEEIRAAFANIQDGMERGNREILVPGGREEPRSGPRDPRGARPAPWAPPASERSIGDNDR